MNKWKQRFYLLVFDLIYQYGIEREELQENYDGIDEGFLKFEKSIVGKD